jgi:hypothetical protein
MDVEFAVCQHCYGRTLEPKLSEDGTKTLCPDCKAAEIEEKRIKEYPLLKAQLAAVTAERDRMREALFGLKAYINTSRNLYLVEHKSAPKDDIDAALLKLECLEAMVDAALESEDK